MTIEREELDQLRVDFSDVAFGRRLPPVHPGEILRNEFLKPMELSVYRLARDIKVSCPRLNEIVLGRRAVTTDTALRLARYFGTTPEFWINLQARYALDVAERTVRPKIDRGSSTTCCVTSTRTACPEHDLIHLAAKLRPLVARAGARMVTLPSTVVEAFLALPRIEGDLRVIVGRKPAPD